MGADRPPAALWVCGRPGGSHRYEEQGLSADAAERVRCLYCTSKPMVAMAVLSLLEQADVELDRARVDGVDGRLVDEGGWPVADLLWHRSPFVGPTIWEALRFPLGTLEEELSRSAAGRRPMARGRATATCWPGSSCHAWPPSWPAIRGWPTCSARCGSWSVPVSGSGPTGSCWSCRSRRRSRSSPGTGGPRSRCSTRSPVGPVPWRRRTSVRSAPSRPWCPGSRPSRRMSTPVPAWRSCSPPSAYLGRALERCGQPGQHHAASLELRAPRTAAPGLVGVQAAGGALVGVVRSGDCSRGGRARWDVPRGSRRTPPVVRRPARRGVDVGGSVGSVGVGDQPSRGPAARAWRGEVPAAVEASGAVRG